MLVQEVAVAIHLHLVELNHKVEVPPSCSHIPGHSCRVHLWVVECLVQETERGTWRGPDYPVRFMLTDIGSGLLSVGLLVKIPPTSIVFEWSKVERLQPFDMEISLPTSSGIDEGSSSVYFNEGYLMRCLNNFHGKSGGSIGLHAQTL